MEEIDADTCDVSQQSQDLDDTGTLETELSLRAIVATGDGREVDCRGPDAGCFLAASSASTDSPAVRWGVAELGFDPDAELAAPPTLRITEGDTFVERTYVTVIGAGFDAASFVAVGQCATGAVSTSACGFPGPPVVVDDDGGFETTIPVLTTGGFADCRTPGRCEVVAVLNESGELHPIRPSRSAAAPITVTEAGREVRYLERVFDAVEVREGLPFGSGTDNGTPVDLSLDVYLPARDDATDRPVILFANVDEFVRRGFVVVSPRLPVVGASRASIEEAYNNTLPVLDWLDDNADELGIDPDKVAAMGHSRGGFIATTLAYGPVAADGDASGLGAAISMAGGALPELIEAGEPPTLYFHGDLDTRAPFALVQEACATAEAVDVGCELVVYQGRGHSIVSDQGSDLRYDIWQKTAEFLVDVFELG